MDLGIITLILSIIALLISILGFLDNRKKTKILEDQNEDNRKKTEIMEKQLNLLQEQSESGQDMRNAVKVVSEIQEEISDLGTEKYDWGDFGRVAPQRFLEKLHDSGEPNIFWTITPLSLFGKSIGKGETTFTKNVNNFEAFKRLFAEMVPKPQTDFTILFLSNPKIMLNPNVEIDKIQVKDYVTEIYSLTVMYDNLKRVEESVNMFDSSILPDIQRIYNKALASLYGIFEGDQEIEISSKIKTKDMQSYLLRFVPLDSWENCIKELKENTRPKMLETMRHLRESA
jgi:hypothetical protein